MKITLTEAFQRNAKTLAAPEQAALLEVLLKIPSSLKDLHRHQGLGLRKIHASGIFEARVGLGLRIVFGYRENEIFLHRVGTHEDVRRYLKSL